MFSLTKFSPTDSPTLLLGYKTPTFPGCIWGWDQSLSGTTKSYYGTPTSIRHQWNTRMNTSFFNRVNEKDPHTQHSCTNGGYSQVWMEKKAPTSLSFHPSNYWCPHWVNMLESNWWQKYLFEAVPRGQPPTTYFRAEMDKQCFGVG